MLRPNWFEPDYILALHIDRRDINLKLSEIVAILLMVVNLLFTFSLMSKFNNNGIFMFYRHITILPSREDY